VETYRQVCRFGRRNLVNVEFVHLCDPVVIAVLGDDKFSVLRDGAIFTKLLIADVLQELLPLLFNAKVDGLR